MTLSVIDPMEFSQPKLPLDMPSSDPSWRPIHYIGSKLRLTDEIRQHLSRLDPSQGRTCDLFAGSGTAALAISKDRPVVAADIQEYSRVICSGLLAPSDFSDSTKSSLQASVSDKIARFTSALEPILTFEQHSLAHSRNNPHDLCDLVEDGSLINSTTSNPRLKRVIDETKSHLKREQLSLLTTTYFGGSYFSYQQSLKLDAILASINQLSETERDLPLAALLSTASNIVNSVGKQFAQPMKARKKDGSIKNHLIGQMYRDRTMDVESIFLSWIKRYSDIPRTALHEIHRGDYREILGKIRDISIVYADPPYTRDHYSRFYHVLETLSLGDFPEISSTFDSRPGNSRGVYRKERHQSPFCIKSQAPRAFDELFDGAKQLKAPILISYSPFLKEGHPRMMTIDALCDLARKHYSKIEVKQSLSISHSKMNKSELHLAPSKIAEVFILCS